MPKPATNSESGVLLQARLDSLSADAYGSLRFNIECSVLGREAKTITITSSGRGEGKTTTSIHLAMAYAQIGKKVMLLDADLRNPSIHLAFGSQSVPGLADYLEGRAAINEIIQSTRMENLSIISSGQRSQNPTRLLSSKQMDTLLDNVRDNYDMVIVDTPSLLTISDAKIVATKCDGVLLIVEYGKVKREVAKKVKEELMLANVRLIGVVLNEVRNQNAVAYL